MVSDENLRFQLEQIQNVIDRQASNSFKIKGWAVTLIVVVLLFRSRDIHLAVAFIPLVGFWYLDSYYLRQEQNFRAIYDETRENTPDCKQELFDMSLENVDDNVDGVLKLAFTKSLKWFYGTIVGLLVIYSFIILSNGMGWVHG